MSIEEHEILKNAEFLVSKSRSLLQEQLKSYDGANTKAGVLISISALLIPIAITFISGSETISLIKYLTIIPTTLMITALTYLLRVLMPKGLDHGFNFDQFDENIEKEHKQVLLFEIGANRGSYNDNMPIVQRQNKNFKTGVKLIFSSAVLILLLVTSGLFLSKEKKQGQSKEVNSKSEVDSKNPNINEMSKENSGSNSNNNQNQQNQQSSQSSNNIPSVPREQRANLQKGADSKPLTKK